jgi:hypothetical protein
VQAVRIIGVEAGAEQTPMAQLVKLILIKVVLLWK